MLKFEFYGEGEWEAYSEMNDGGDRFTWRISVCDDGEFTASQSDGELLGPTTPVFERFKDAVAWCNEQERVQVASARLQDS